MVHFCGDWNEEAGCPIGKNLFEALHQAITSKLLLRSLFSPAPWAETWHFFGIWFKWPIFVLFSVMMLADLCSVFGDDAGGPLFCFWWWCWPTFVLFLVILLADLFFLFSVMMLADLCSVFGDVAGRESKLNFSAFCYLFCRRHVTITKKDN